MRRFEQFSSDFILETKQAHGEGEHKTRNSEVMKELFRPFGD